jgi:histidinol phosphate phosphatase HisJ family
MIKSNYHTHSLYCDGKDTLSDMAKTAFDSGFTSLGFSSHAYTGLKEDECGILLEDIESYGNTIDYLKEEYRGRMQIFKGMEIEAGWPYPTKGFDYSILSCHYISTDIGILSVDYTPEMLKDLIVHTGGLEKFLETYYSTILNAAKTVDSQIIGHIDLYTKFEEKEHIVETVPNIAYDAITTLVKMGRIFELNTGAIARGYRTTPYPSIPLLKHLKTLKAPIMVNSDCHDRKALSCWFPEAEELLLSLGFKTRMEMNDNGFVEVPLTPERHV